MELIRAQATDRCPGQISRAKQQTSAFQHSGPLASTIAKKELLHSCLTECWLTQQDLSSPQDAEQTHAECATDLGC
jgi:hypothetical protein